MGNIFFKKAREVLKTKKNPVLIDLGAHTGGIAAAYGKGVDGLTCYCVEACPLSCEGIKERLKNDPSIIIVNAAIADKVGEIDF